MKNNNTDVQVHFARLLRHPMEEGHDRGTVSKLAWKRFENEPLAKRNRFGHAKI